MYDPNDDIDVTSGTTDGAQMETTSPPDARYIYLQVLLGLPPSGGVAFLYLLTWR